MIDSGTIAYIRGLVHLASSCAKGVAPSMITVEGFGQKRYARDFSERYDIPEEQLRFVQAEGSLVDWLDRWFRVGDGVNRMIVNGLIRLLRRRIGDPKHLYILENEAEILPLFADRKQRQGPFPVMEGLLFAVYKEGTLCFIRGREE